MKQLSQHTDAIIKLCQTHRVKSLYAFGSVLTEDFNDESDVDLIVDFTPMAIEQYADNYFGLKYSLQSVLKRDVDLLEETAIKNPYFKKSINQQRQLVYGQ